MDTNTAALKKNAYRVTKERGITCLRVRVPGGHLDAKYLPVLQEIAENCVPNLRSHFSMLITAFVLVTCNIGAVV